MAKKPEEPERISNISADAMNRAEELRFGRRISQAPKPTPALPEEQVIEDALVKLVEPVLKRYKESVLYPQTAKIDYRNFAAHDIIKVVIAKLHSLDYPSPSEARELERAAYDKAVKFCHKQIDANLPEIIDASEKIGMERVFETIDPLFRDLYVLANEFHEELADKIHDKYYALKSKLLGEQGKEG